MNDGPDRRARAGRRTCSTRRRTSYTQGLLADTPQLEAAIAAGGAPVEPGAPPVRDRSPRASSRSPRSSSGSSRSGCRRGGVRRRRWTGARSSTSGAARRRRRRRRGSRTRSSSSSRDQGPRRHLPADARRARAARPRRAGGAYWPEFAAEGKGDDHGRPGARTWPAVPGPPRRLHARTTCSTPGACRRARPPRRRLARARRSPTTRSPTAGSATRSSAGSTAAASGGFFAEEIAAPLGLDLWIGLPEEQEERVAPPRPGGRLRDHLPRRRAGAAARGRLRQHLRGGVGWNEHGLSPRRDPGRERDRRRALAGPPLRLPRAGRRARRRPAALRGDRAPRPRRSCPARDLRDHAPPVRVRGRVRAADGADAIRAGARRRSGTRAPAGARTAAGRTERVRVLVRDDRALARGARRPRLAAPRRARRLAL